MNDSRFFDRIRITVYNGRIPQISVGNINIILRYWQTNFPNNIHTQLAYILATVRAEVGKKMEPVRETFASSDEEARIRLRDKPYARPVPPHGHAYYGRGYVQLTWFENYKVQENKINVPLVEFPDLALVPENAIQILVNGMMAGDFNEKSHGLSYYVNKQKTDFVQARQTVNLFNRADEIAGYARTFLDAIEYASAGVNIRSDILMPSPEHMEAQYLLLSSNEME
jgi:hypothetical protein